MVNIRWEDSRLLSEAIWLPCMTARSPDRRQSDGLYAVCSKNGRSAVRDGSDVCHGESAKEIGIFNEVGSISVGKRADFVLLDQELNIAAVYIDGKEFTC